MVDLFSGLDAITSDKEKVFKAPFPYPGGKKKLTKHILPHLPNRKIYVEPFGGSGAVLLARNKAGLEVYNDRFGGVTEFYRCIRNKALLDRLIERLSLTICSKDEFYYSKEAYKTATDTVERAALWYYTMVYSFGGIGRNWGRAKSPIGVQAGLIQQKIPEFRDLHRRLQQVQIENRDWYSCCTDYDGKNTVFYLDPPYLETDCHVYDGSFGSTEHHDLCRWATGIAEGFVAVSSYQNSIYDSYDWDDVFEFERTDAMVSKGTGEGNCKTDRDGPKGTVVECLYIKE